MYSVRDNTLSALFFYLSVIFWQSADNLCDIYDNQWDEIHENKDRLAENVTYRDPALNRSFVR